MGALRTRKKILVVDDDADIRAGLQVLLMPDYEVFVASNGAEAISRAQSQDFDLLLTDVNLPDIDSLEIARNVRKISRDIKAVLPFTGSVLDVLPSAGASSSNLCFGRSFNLLARVTSSSVRPRP